MSFGVRFIVLLWFAQTLLPLQLRSQSVSVLQSSSDQRELLVRKHLEFGHTAGASQVNIAIDPTVRLQVMDGFGASLTDSSATLIEGLSREQHAALMQELFAADGPLGLTLLREPIGASDFSGHGDYSYDDTLGGKPDPELASFSIKPDQAMLFPLLREAEHLNPQLRVMALPWSAPAWMKSKGNMHAGSLKDRNIDAYAHYLARTVEAYSAERVPLYALALQNEPLNENASYPTQLMQPSQEAALAAKLVPLLSAAGRSPLLLGYEHNWNNLEYPGKLLAESARLSLKEPALFAGISFHCYGGNETAQTAFLLQHPGTRLWFTECSATNGSSFAETFLWQGRHLLLGAPMNGACSVLLWNVVLDPNGGPHNGGCADCTPLIKLAVHNGEMKLERTAGYYLLAHAAPYVHPGAIRLGTSLTGSNDMLTTAYQNLDGTFVLLALNMASASSTVRLSVAGQSVTDTVPAQSLTTYMWGERTPVVHWGTVQLVVGDSNEVLTATPGQSRPTVEVSDGSPRQIWTIHRLTSGRFEIRNVGTAQALAVSSTGNLTLLTLDGSRIAALELRATPEGFCILSAGKSMCATVGSIGMLLSGDLLRTEPLDITLFIDK